MPFAPPILVFRSVSAIILTVGEHGLFTPLVLSTSAGGISDKQGKRYSRVLYWLIADSVFHC